MKCQLHIDIALRYILTLNLSLIYCIVATCLQRVSVALCRAAGRCSSTRASAADVVARRFSLSAADGDDEVWLSASPAPAVEGTATAAPAVEGSATATVAVDVTGATFLRQCAYLQSRRPTPELPSSEVDGDDHSAQFDCVLRPRRSPSRGAAPSDPESSQYGFSAVRRVPSTTRQTAQPATRENARRATSETREYRRRRQEMTSSVTSSSSTSTASVATPAGQQVWLIPFLGERVGGR